MKSKKTIFKLKEKKTISKKRIRTKEGVGTKTKHLFEKVSMKFITFRGQVGRVLLRQISTCSLG